MVDNRYLFSGIPLMDPLIICSLVVCGSCWIADSADWIAGGTLGSNVTLGELH